MEDLRVRLAADERPDGPADAARHGLRAGDHGDSGPFLESLSDEAASDSESCQPDR